MRNAGLLELTEVPAAWHDESPRFDGTTACVIRPQSVGRLESSVATELTWSEVKKTSVERTEQERMSITVHGDSIAFTCHFGPNEGAERFLRQVEAEVAKLSAPEPLTPSSAPPDLEPLSTDP
jgi:hypothetical protein